MTRFSWRLALIVPVLFLSCSTETPPKVSRPTALAGEGAAALRLDLQTDHAVYAVGQPVELTLAITNSGPDPISITAPSSQLYDFIVLKEGREVWRWSADKMFLTVVTRLTIFSGETRAFTERWDQRDRDGRLVTPGNYRVVGILVGGEPLGLTARHLAITIR